VHRGDRGCTREIGNRPGHSQHSLPRAPRERKTLHRVRKDALTEFIRATKALHTGVPKARICYSLTRQLQAAGARHARRRRSGSLARLARSRREVPRRQPWNFHLHVDAVEEWRRDAAAIGTDLSWGAAAVAGGISVASAGTGVHRGNQLEFRGVAVLQRRTRDGDAAALERLTQCLQRGTCELRHLI
jgi:hypothetical protein